MPEFRVASLDRFEGGLYLADSTATGPIHHRDKHIGFDASEVDKGSWRGADNEGERPC